MVYMRKTISNFEQKNYIYLKTITYVKPNVHNITLKVTVALNNQPLCSIHFSKFISKDGGETNTIH